MRANRWMIAVVLLGLGGVTSVPAFALPPDGTQTVTTMLTALCTTTPQLRGLPPPFLTTVPVTLTVPRRVHQGATFDAQVTVGFPVDAAADIGGARVAVAPGVTPSSGLVAVPGNSPSIVGTLTFTATGKPGTLAQWRLDFFGQAASVGVNVEQTCVPTTDVVLAYTRIIGGGASSSG